MDGIDKLTSAVMDANTPTAMMPTERSMLRRVHTSGALGPLERDMFRLYSEE